MTVKDVVVTVSGRPVHALHRRGDGPTVVLLHGASGNAETWRPLLELWAGFNLWCLDLPGRGGSSGPACASARDAADLVAELAHVLEWGPAILVGHSYGGAVALAVSLRDPRRFGGYVLVSSGARLRVAPPILEAVEEATDDAPFSLEGAFGASASRATVDAYLEASRRTPAEAARSDWRACDGFDVREALSEVDAPVLVVWGSEDALTPPKHQRRLAEALPQASPAEVAGVGHMLPWEAPEALVDAVRRWIQATAP